MGMTESHVCLPYQLYDQMAAVYYAYRGGHLVEASPVVEDALDEVEDLDEPAPSEPQTLHAQVSPGERFMSVQEVLRESQESKAPSLDDE